MPQAVVAFESRIMENIIEEVTGSDYKYGFVTHVETDTIEKGLSEETIRAISAKKLPEMADDEDAAVGAIGYPGD